MGRGSEPASRAPDSQVETKVSSIISTPLGAPRLILDAQVSRNFVTMENSALTIVFRSITASVERFSQPSGLGAYFGLPYPAAPPDRVPFGTGPLLIHPDGRLRALPR